jgi:hypothetical protein
MGKKKKISNIMNESKGEGEEKEKEREKKTRKMPKYRELNGHLQCRRFSLPPPPEWCVSP